MQLTTANPLDAEIYRKIKSVKSSKLAQQNASAVYDRFFNSMPSKHLVAFFGLKETFFKSVSGTNINIDLVSTERKYINFVLRHGRNNNRKFVKMIALAWEKQMWTSEELLDRVQYFSVCIFTSMQERCLASYKKQDGEKDQFQGLLIGNMGYKRQKYFLQNNPTSEVNGVAIEGVSPMHDELFDTTVYLYSAVLGGFQPCDVIHANLHPEIYLDTIGDKSCDEWLCFFDRED